MQSKNACEESTLGLIVSYKIRMYSQVEIALGNGTNFPPKKC